MAPAMTETEVAKRPADAEPQAAKRPRTAAAEEDEFDDSWADSVARPVPTAPTSAEDDLDDSWADSVSRPATSSGAAAGPAASQPSPATSSAGGAKPSEAAEQESRVPLERLRGANRDLKPAWMTKGCGVGKEMFGEATGELLKPGLTKTDLEKIESKTAEGPDPFGELFREAVGTSAASTATVPLESGTSDKAAQAAPVAATATVAPEGGTNGNAAEAAPAAAAATAAPAEGGTSHNAAAAVTATAPAEGGTSDKAAEAAPAAATTTVPAEGGATSDKGAQAAPAVAATTTAPPEGGTTSDMAVDAAPVAVTTTAPPEGETADKAAEVTAEPETKNGEAPAVEAAPEDGPEAKEQPAEALAEGSAPDSLTVFVGSISYSVDEDQFELDFSECGEIASLKFLENKGVAFITYETPEGVAAALKLDGDQYWGRTIKVQLAGARQPRGAKGPEMQENEVCVKGLEPETTEAALRKTFGDCGKLSGLRLPRDEAGNSKGVAFLTFQTKEGMDKALELDGKEVDGTKLIVEQARARGGKGKEGKGKGGDKGDKGGDRGKDRGRGKGKDGKGKKGKGKGKKGRRDG